MGVWSCVGVPRFVDSVTEVSENCGRAGHVVGGPCLERLGTSTVNGFDRERVGGGVADVVCGS